MHGRYLAAIYTFALLLMTRAISANEVQPVIKVAPEFAIEKIYTVPRDSQGSWISLCADKRGVLYASDQLGPLYRIEIPPASGGEALRSAGRTCSTRAPG